MRRVHSVCIRGGELNQGTPGGAGRGAEKSRVTRSGRRIGPRRNRVKARYRWVSEKYDRASHRYAWPTPGITRSIECSFRMRNRRRLKAYGQLKFRVSSASHPPNMWTVWSVGMTLIHVVSLEGATVLDRLR